MNLKKKIKDSWQEPNININIDDAKKNLTFENKKVVLPKRLIFSLSSIVVILLFLTTMVVYNNIQKRNLSNTNEPYENSTIISPEPKSDSESKNMGEAMPIRSNANYSESSPFKFDLDAYNKWFDELDKKEVSYINTSKDFNFSTFLENSRQVFISYSLIYYFNEDYIIVQKDNKFTFYYLENAEQLILNYFDSIR